jgi:hypothetical protein
MRGRGIDSFTGVPTLLRRLWTPLLIAWFAGQTYGRLSTFVRNQVPLGLDARIYYRAVQNWLAGIDPWRADVVFNRHTFSFAGTPATVVVLAPAALISENAFVVVSLVSSALAATLIVRWLRLPAWWLLFPPLTEVLYSGNPQLVVLLLLLVSGRAASGVASAVSVGLKIYAAVPLAGLARYRDVVLGLGLTALTVIVAPHLWVTYVREFGTISARLDHESANGFSAFSYPLLLVPVVVLLLILARTDRPRAGWLAVPAVWPASEFHYSTFAMPVMSPLLAFLLAIPSQQLPPVAIALDISWRLGSGPLRRRLAQWRPATGRSTANGGTTLDLPEGAAGR